ncbi:MAG TPA: PRC-barrel domain-containing protein, partial [Micromonospora sp.]
MLIGFDLLDRQIVDRDGTPVGKVDDVELDRDDDGRWYVVALLTGVQALGARVGGIPGKVLSGGLTGLAGGHTTARRIPYRLVRAVESAVHLSVRRDVLPEP